MITTTKGELYITALTTLERLDIQFVPETLDKSRTANINPLAVIGRNNPLHHYSGGEDSLSLELDFYASTENREDVVSSVRWLEALAANDGPEGAQELVRLTFGNLFRDEVWIVKQVNSKMSLFDEQKGWLPRQAYVSLTLSLDTKTATRQRDIKWRTRRSAPRF